MSDFKSRLNKNAQKFINLYSFLLQSYNTNDVMKFASLFFSFDDYLTLEMDKILDFESLKKKRKDEILKIIRKKNAYEKLKNSIDESLKCPELDLLVDICADSDYKTDKILYIIHQDPTFHPLRDYNTKDLLNYIKKASKILSIEKKINEIISKEYYEEMSNNDDCLYICMIKLIATLTIDSIQGKYGFPIDCETGVNVNDIDLLNKILKDMKEIDGNKISCDIQEISSRIMSKTNFVTPYTATGQLSHSSYGKYHEYFHAIDINSMILYKSIIDKDFDDLVTLISLVITLEHENAHGINHMVGTKLYYQILANNVSIEEIVNAMEKDNTLYIAAASLIEAMMYIFEDIESDYNSLIEELNSRNREQEFLDNLISITNNEETKKKLKCLYYLTATEDATELYKHHIPSYIKKLREHINKFRNKSFDRLLIPFLKILDAIELYYKRISDNVFVAEYQLNKKCFPYIYDEALLKKHTDVSNDLFDKYNEMTLDITDCLKNVAKE